MRYRSNVDNMSYRNGIMLRKREAVQRRWTKCFEKLSKMENWGEAIVICLSVNANAKRTDEQDGIRREVERIIINLKYGRASDIDGITVKMLKYGKDASHMYVGLDGKRKARRLDKGYQCSSLQWGKREK